MLFPFPRVPSCEGISSHLHHHQAALCGFPYHPRSQQLSGAVTSVLLNRCQLRDAGQRNPCQQRVRSRTAYPTVEEAPSQPDHLHGAAADGAGEEIPEAEVSVHSRQVGGAVWCRGSWAEAWERDVSCTSWPEISGQQGQALVLCAAWIVLPPVGNGITLCTYLRDTKKEKEILPAF